MPNWVYNTLTVTGKPHLLRKFLAECFTEGNLDFEKIVPKPEGFDALAESGSAEDAYKAIYQTAELREEYRHYSSWVNEDISTNNALQQFIADRQFDGDVEKLKQAAAVYKKNIDLTGAPTWYEWNNHYWGTKWNAGDCDVLGEADRGQVEVCFDTAWCEPRPIFEALAKKYPYLFFEYITRYEGENEISGRSYNTDYEEAEENADGSCT